MSDEERARFNDAYEAGTDAGERARYWAGQGNRAAAERYLLAAAAEIDAALRAVGSRKRVQVVEEPKT